MADFPAMPLWTDALLADCAHLSDADFGLYIKMLIAMWRLPACRMPNENTWLARRFNRSVEKVGTELRPLIDEFCQCDGNWITQKRLLKEFLFVTKQRRQRVVAARARWDKEKKPSGRIAAAMHPHPHPHQPIHTVTTTETVAARGRVNGGGDKVDLEHERVRRWRVPDDLEADLRKQRPDLIERQIRERTKEWRAYAIEHGIPRNFAKSWMGFLLKTERRRRGGIWG